ncbi:MAG: hypothetical protein IMZ52_01655 [Actinobacteria bacterium]|nr:hypothetical protein [Actinomycetota bacterium]MBE3114812.1 hypothetical protein [Actinomycetota bacterium]
MKIEIGDIYRYTNKVVLKIIDKFDGVGYGYDILKSCNIDDVQFNSDIYWILEHPYTASDRMMKGAIKGCERISEKEALAWCI